MIYNNLFLFHFFFAFNEIWEIQHLREKKKNHQSAWNNFMYEKKDMQLKLGFFKYVI